MLKIEEKNLQMNDEIVNFVFTQDRFFKYIFLSQDKDSLYLCNLLFKEILGQQYKMITNINTHYLSKNNEKGMISDIMLDVDNILRINMEMQNEVTDIDMKRFDMYLSRMYFESVKNYKDAKDVIQILFLNKQYNELIQKSNMKDEKCQTTSKSWLRISIFMKQIKEIIKQKGLDNLSELEKMIYIFAYGNISDIIDSEKRTGRITKVVKIMERKRDEFLSIIDEQMRLYTEYTVALSRDLYLKEQIEEGINRGIKQGIEQGIEQGIQQGITQGIQQGIERGIHMEREQNNKKMLDAIIHLSKNMNITYTKAMDILNISKDEQEKYLKLLNT